MAKKRKFASGGDIEYMSPEENETSEMQKIRSAKKRLVPLVLQYKPRSVKYDSIRPKDFEENIKKQKREAVEEGIKGGSKASSVLPALASVPMAGPAGVASQIDNIRSGAEQMKSAYRKYRDASESEDAAERELEAQNRREARGMKSGGFVSASKRADGCAQRGKTRGKIV